MTEKQVFHPAYGRSVKNGATDTCSKCGHTIPWKHVPLMMWDSADDNIMWVFCEGCEKPILETMMSRLKSQ